ncbi:hypothetical protein ACFVDT_07045 [Streptomyces sp. NPDC057699]|uniref:hypothetical protein n=1 Tax=Streptomyces sp. NPDC057699 TaxID=3346220 RepID=UPI003682F97C
MLRTTMLTVATATVAASLLLTACATTPTSTPSPAPAAPVAAGNDRAAHTRQVFTITWGGTSEAQRTQLCDGLVLLGPEQSAAEMAAGASGSQDVDWDLMTELLAAECDQR